MYVAHSGPWTAQHDDLLRKECANYTYDMTRPFPWPVIARRLARLGHNSTSCKNRWEAIKDIKTIWTEGETFQFAGSKQRPTSEVESTVRVFRGLYNKEITAADFL